MNSSPLLEAKSGTTFMLHHAAHGVGKDARFDESLLALALSQGPTACIWQAVPSLVVPRSYRRFDAFEEACQHFLLRGWPIVVRQTGGGIVPQGPGIVNFSMAYVVEGPPMRHSEAGYLLICDVLCKALATLGIDAFPATVEASFCDGRYNLAVTRGNQIAKIAGTAQMWRRVPGTGNHHVGLVHALVLADTNTSSLTGVLNEFEAMLGNELRYQPESVISLAEYGLATPPEGAFIQALEAALATVRL